ncbi:MAG: hypothetical protein HYR73_02010 [Candidatus Eisenbacteria bacterium]|nr:hypothetical protein [Candidatus Eisenbacteria bacterium]
MIPDIMGGEFGRDRGSTRDPRVGLCSVCRHGRTVETPRSVFWLCDRSKSDPSFERYPRLPVMQCPGHERGDPQPFKGDGVR